MAKNTVSNIRLSADSLSKRILNEGDQVVRELSIDSLVRTKLQHKWKPRGELKAAQMADSIARCNGVQQPIIVRPHAEQEGKYEVIAGYRRIQGCIDNEYESIPALIKDMDDDTAILVINDTNLEQREEHLPSELGWAFRTKMEVFEKRIGRPNNDEEKGGTGFHLFFGEKTRDILGKEVGLTGRQVEKYINITYLSEALLDMLDDGKLSVKAGVQLIELSDMEKDILASLIEQQEKGPTESQAKDIALHKGSPDFEKNVESILSAEKSIERKITFSGEWLKKIFPREATPKQMEAVISDLLNDERVQAILKEKLASLDSKKKADRLDEKVR